MKIRCPYCHIQDWKTEILTEKEIVPHMRQTHNRIARTLADVLNSFETLGILDVVEEDVSESGQDNAEAKK